jgi:diguanylate cyclase (GGDEF)-like protein
MSTNPSPNVVLAVDDDVANIEILAAILDAECEMICATDGAQAIELATTAQPDLILLDVVMPDMDGYAVLTALKREPATADIPVIFITGRNDSDAEVHGLELGAADYISKPLSPPVVRIRVRNQLELKRARDELRAHATTDGLTGLANRRQFDEVFRLEYNRHTRTEGWLSLVMLDVDHFKAYNDHYGHVVGDECLRRIAAALRSVVKRASDLPARYGGEEFALILPETNLDSAVQIAEAVREAIAATAIEHCRSPVAGHVTASLGVASTKCVADGTPLDLIAQADGQLYAAKAAGRNQIRAIELA